MPDLGMATLLDPKFDEHGDLLGKRCRRCQDWFEIGHFYRPKGFKHGRAICKKCWSERHWSSYEEQALERQDPSFRAKYIVKDASATDRRRGFANDLAVGWVAEEIAKGCAYCEETQLRMTLDRIDNDKGHVHTNVLPACIRCNFLRKTMPYDAWMCLVPGLREARLKGLFGAWTGAIRRAGGRRMALGLKKTKKADPWANWPSPPTPPQEPDPR